MTAFVIASLVLVVLVLGYVLRPLWQSRPFVAAGIFAALSFTTVLVYALIGTPNALDPAQRRAPETLPEAISQLEAELERDPNQVEGWRLLGRAYAAEGQATKARDALARAVKLAPTDPDLLAEAAESRALAARDRKFDTDAVAMLRTALAQQPMHQRARWFLGIAQRQAGQPAAAANTWEPLLTIVDVKTAASLREQVNAARTEAGLAPLPATATATTATAAGTSIKVSVSLSPDLAMQLPDNATVFVIARQPNGSPMPVAVEKLQAGAFPLVVTLDDNDNLMPTSKLSQLDDVEITARISASGDATPQNGDFEATPTSVPKGQRAAALMIDRVRR